MKILALTGFLGLASDFDPLFQNLRREGLSFEAKVIACNRMNLQDENSELQDEGLATPDERLDAKQLAPVEDWNSWLSQIEPELRKWAAGEAVLGIGYSMGGRLLLSLAEKDPSRFAGLVLLSTNPGLKQESEKPARLKNDEAWAHRFENDSWGEVLRDWNAQAVFHGGKQDPPRPALAYSRQHLARVLRAFSLARQKDFRPWIQAGFVPQLWMTGEQDPKFRALIEELAPTGFAGSFQKTVVPQASHRILADQPSWIAGQIAKFARDSVVKSRLANS